MAPLSNKRLILVRHAHRDKRQGRQEDNGLSDKGRDQARHFTSEIRKALTDRKVAVLSSPKLRCVETVSELADALGVPVRISLLLDEQRESPPESGKRFKSRVKRFLNWWRHHGPEVVVACSHGDWIPESLSLATGQEEALSKGRWVVLELSKGSIRRKGP